MSKVLIYKTGLNDGSQNEIPNLGMGILAREMKRIGHEVVIYDGHFHRMPETYIHELIANNDIICLSLASQEWNLAQTQWVIELAHVLKKTVILGGPHAYAYWDILLNDKRIDKIVVGEVDYQVEKVLTTNSPVVNIGRANVLSSPDFSSLIGKDNVLGYPLYTSRGCTNLCCFCMGGKIHRGWRHREFNADFFTELASLKTYPNLKRVYIIDDCFSANLDHAKQVLIHWKTLGYYKKYSLCIVNVRADQIDEELLSLMADCRIEELPIGVESADEEVFRYVGKGETLDDIKKAIMVIQEAGITPWLNMIVGLPHDNPKRHNKSLRWVLDIKGPKVTHWFQFSPFRNTKAYDWLIKQGAIDDGFIPSAYGRRYDELPWYPEFETEDFTKVQRARAQLQAFLLCGSPILINVPNLWKVSCELGLIGEYNLWEKIAPIQDYVEKHLGYKKEREQA